jgi:hypothetical protein
MSRPDRAVVAVERLKAFGYEAMVELPADDDTSSFISAWSTEEDGDTEGVANLVLEVDHGATELPDDAEERSRP